MAQDDGPVAGPEMGKSATVDAPENVSGCEDPSLAVAVVERAELTRMFAIMRERFGFDLGVHEPATLERRITRRMALQKIDSLHAYMRLLEREADELRVLHSDLLIGVTRFFRDIEPFEALKAKHFARIMQEKRPGDVVRVWVPGCSTGEEIYSLAISLLEYLGPRAADYTIQMFGTDLDPSAIAVARHGAYGANIALDVSAERLHRFFVKSGGAYRVDRRVRDLIVFSQHDLTHDAPFSDVDLVSCRNVLIYLRPEARKRVLRNFHYALRPAGLLMLGSSETVGDHEDLFATADHVGPVFAKRNVVTPRRLDGTSAAPVSPLAAIQRDADREVLERYGPPGLVVDENLEIVQVRGRTGAYIASMPHAATFSLEKLARAELFPALRHDIQVAMRDHEVVRSRVILPGTDEARPVDLEVIPLGDPDAAPRCALVVFLEQPAGGCARLDASIIAAQSGPARERLTRLERELSATKDHLRTTLDELQASREELRCTKEELEAAKEELRAVGRELATVNDELRSRISDQAFVTVDVVSMSPQKPSDLAIRGAVSALVSRGGVGD